VPKRLKKVFRDGKWEEGSATPWLPPEQMRSLPADLQTRDTSDPDRVHELDAPHIVDALKADWEARQQGRDPITGKPVEDTSRAKKYRVAQPGENVPLNQEQVDFVRMRVLKAVVDQAYEDTLEGRCPDLSVRHVWFPHDNVNIYELRDGPAPVRSLRPKRLRSLDLEIDMYNWPRRIVGILEESGQKVPDVRKECIRAMEEAAFRRELS
jgi:hypothetical protein